MSVRGLAVADSLRSPTRLLDAQGDRWPRSKGIDERHGTVSNAARLREVVLDVHLGPVDAPVHRSCTYSPTLRSSRGPTTDWRQPRLVAADDLQVYFRSLEGRLRDCVGGFIVGVTRSEPFGSQSVETMERWLAHGNLVD